MKKVRQLSLIFATGLGMIFSGCSSEEKVGSALGTLPAPTGVALSGYDATSLTFVWNEVNGASSYGYILYDSEGTTLLIKSTDEATVTISDLTEGETYSFAVQAVGGNSYYGSKYSELIMATPSSADTPDPVLPSTFQLPSYEDSSIALAFPGAEGGGMYTTGGRGGAVYHVTNLNDSGDGSLRWALSKSGARTIVFDVDGVIYLNSRLIISNGNVTIAGQTAPGDGICLANYPMIVSADNVIVRYIRSRLGNAAVATNDYDAMEGQLCKNVIIDHCSMSWSVDECASFYANTDFTMQWCIISESLRNAGHAKGSHGYGGIWGGTNASYHHNLLAHHDSRNPRFDHPNIYPNSTDITRSVDYRNCVVYNFGNFPSYGGEGALNSINFMGNYYKWGPASYNGGGPSFDSSNNPVANSAKRRQYFVELNAKNDGADFGYPSIYVDTHTSNKFDYNGYATDTNGLNTNNWNGIRNGDGTSSVNGNYVELTAQVAITPAYNSTAKSAWVSYHNADNAFTQVLAYAGANKSRDAVDQRAVNDTQSGIATITDGGNGSINGYVDNQDAAGGWPTYASGTSLLDSDGDGIPDDIEDAWGLNKNNSADGNTYTLDTTGRYTNLEMYLYYLVQETTLAQVANATYTELN